MRKNRKSFTLILLGATVMAVSNTSFGQCLKLKDGTKIESTTSSWVNTLIQDKKFQNGNDAKRDEMVEQYNKDILSGKVKGFGGVPVEMIVKNSSSNGNNSSVDVTMGPYAFPIECVNDTLLLYRNKGMKPIIANDPLPPSHPNGWVNANEVKMTEKTIGLMIQGANIIPNNLQVGDALPMYEDFIISLPQSFEVKTTVLESVNTSVHYGTRATTYSTTYNFVTANVNTTISANTRIMHHVFAKVTETEELKIGKNTYTAYVIQSEKWQKNEEIEGFESESEVVLRELEKGKRRFDEIVEKKLKKKGIINEGGYIVDYVTEWFVPGIGIVKMESVDMHGVITASSETTNIK